MWCFMSKEFNVELVWLQSGLLPIDMAPQTEYKRLALNNEAHVGLNTGLLLTVYKISPVGLWDNVQMLL